MATDRTYGVRQSTRRDLFEYGYIAGMIARFGADSALLLIDVQRGVDLLEHWGGPTARRNNPDAEITMIALLEQWRRCDLVVAFTRHDSREASSPLKFALPTGDQKEGFEPSAGEIVVAKDVNSGFVGTSLEVQLRRRGVNRLVIAGFFTNMCVETTTRMAGNLGFDTYLVSDGCATTNRIGPDGVDHDPEFVHQMTLANLHGEFCTAITGADAIGLLASDADQLDRAQGNE
jgi:nicotinamidase-related amidase